MFDVKPNGRVDYHPFDSKTGEVDESCVCEAWPVDMREILKAGTGVLTDPSATTEDEDPSSEEDSQAEAKAAEEAEAKAAEEAEAKAAEEANANEGASAS